MSFFSMKSQDILRPNVAGRFYPSDANELTQMVDEYIREAEIEPAQDPIFAVLCPHAGYVFSGPVAGYSFRYVQNQNPDTVLVVALSHRGVDGGCLFSGKQYQTPLGSIDVDQELVTSLNNASDTLYCDASPYQGEHSVEVVLPFIQRVFPQAKVASLLMTHTHEDLCQAVGHALAKVLNSYSNNVLIVVSSDMSHFPPYEVANRVDQTMLKTLESLDPPSIYRQLKHLMQQPAPDFHCVMCGSAPMLAVVEAARELSATKGKMLHYRNSGDTPYGDQDRVVGYGAFAILKNNPDASPKKVEEKGVIDETLSDVERRTLLRLARESIFDRLHGRSYEPSCDHPNLQKQRGVFVTLKNQASLRGCLGRFDPDSIPLYKLVAVMAYESAQHDIRFTPVTLEELPMVDIQISVLSPLAKVHDVDEIKIGYHGLQVQGLTPSGVRCSGTLLPQVATEQGWNVEEFLQHTCIKAGLDPEAWKDPSTEIYKYGAEIFGDLDYAQPPYTLDAPIA